MNKLVKDHHSFSKPNESRIKHLNWDAEVDFETRIITAIATFDLVNAKDAKEVVFDVKDLTDYAVKVDGIEAKFELGEKNDLLGSALTIDITENTKQVSISYKTSPDAGALLWVEGEKPFLFSQSQAILARTWIPCQDSPGVRYTYDAKVKVRQDLLALMSAENPTEKNDTGVYTFKMDQPIPSYLMALAVGNVEYRAIGDRTGVYAEPNMIEKAHYEFQEMDEMLVEAEKLYGPYVWDQYDVIVLPAAFPFGGMENPRLTFATPTIIAGDRSLTSLIAHELAHSWSGNLVTNSTWDDFWLNEGFTVYFEMRIMEAVYGREYSEMLALLSQQGLMAENEEIMASSHPEDTELKLKLEGRNPDDGMTAIAYDKGYFLLRLMEETVGRERFDAFLKEYFTSHSFQVMDTENFLTYLKANLLSDEEAENIKLTSWIYEKGIPDNIPTIQSDKMVKVDELAKGLTAASDVASIPWGTWKYQEQVRFLSQLPDGLKAPFMAKLDQEFDITNIGNNEVLFEWLEQSIYRDYEPAFSRAESFLINVGRRKFLTPLYRAFKETERLELARSIYTKARPNYHSVAVETMDDLLKD
ncbi:MAG: M1 family metallopeptidase [Flavobacteriales bacterium]